MIKFIGHFCHHSLTFQDYPYATGVPDPGVPYSDFSPVVMKKDMLSLLRLLKEYFFFKFLSR